MESGSWNRSNYGKNAQKEVYSFVKYVGENLKKR